MKLLNLLYHNLLCTVLFLSSQLKKKNMLNNWLKRNKKKIIYWIIHQLENELITGLFINYTMDYSIGKFTNYTMDYSIGKCTNYTMDYSIGKCTNYTMDYQLKKNNNKIINQ